MPRRRGPRVSVQQQHRRAVAAVAHIDRCLSDVDLIRLEACQHAPSLPVLSIDAGFIHSCLARAADAVHRTVLGVLPRHADPGIHARVRDPARLRRRRGLRPVPHRPGQITLTHCAQGECLRSDGGPCATVRGDRSRWEKENPVVSCPLLSRSALPAPTRIRKLQSCAAPIFPWCSRQISGVISSQYAVAAPMPNSGVSPRHEAGK
jgi:hypothetical protein